MSYNSVTLENIQNHFRKDRHYTYVFLEGLKLGAELENALKEPKVSGKSHRRIRLSE